MELDQSHEVDESTTPIDQIAVVKPTSGHQDIKRISHIQGSELPYTLLLMLSGAWLTQAISTAAHLKLADFVKDGPKSIEELATETHFPARSLSRLLRVLVSVEIFVEIEDNTFAQSALSRLLRSDIPNSLYGMARIVGDEWSWRPWEDFEYSLQTGKPAFEHVYGMSQWRYFQERNPGAGEHFDMAMAGLTAQVNKAIAATYDFSPFTTLVDVAGGTGAFLELILQKYPHLKGVLFDLSPTIERAKTHFASEELTERCTFISGSFFDFVPEGADLYIMKHVMKACDDTQVVTILTNFHRAMKPGGKLLIVEPLFTQQGMVFEKRLDLHLLVLHGGYDRSEEEYRKLFESAGFTMSVVATMPSDSIIEGVPLF